MALSRFTNPGAFAPMLAQLPAEPRAIASLARAQTIHHNLLPHFGVARELWPSLPRVRPPRLDSILQALAAIPPHTLSEARRPEQRIVSACVLESHFFAGLLRHRGHRVRIRVGYFKNIRSNADHVVAFWERVMREKGVQADLLKRDPELWRETVNAFSQRQNDVDHHIEHWICELWDEDAAQWRLLDANDEFLRAHSGLDVGFFLAPDLFEYAHEGWLRIRTGDCDPDQYREDEQDGRSHARSQLLWDMASLLNHDGAGIDDPDGGTTHSSSGRRTTRRRRRSWPRSTSSRRCWPPSASTSSPTSTGRRRPCGSKAPSATGIPLSSVAEKDGEEESPVRP